MEQVIAPLPSVAKWHAGLWAPEVRMWDEVKAQSEPEKTNMLQPGVVKSQALLLKKAALPSPSERGTVAKRRRCSVDTEVIPIRVARWQQQTLPAPVPERQRGSLEVRGPFLSLQGWLRRQSGL